MNSIEKNVTKFTSIDRPCVISLPIRKVCTTLTKYLKNTFITIVESWLALILGWSYLNHIISTEESLTKRKSQCVWYYNGTKKCQMIILVQQVFVLFFFRKNTLYGKKNRARNVVPSTCLAYYYLKKNTDKQTWV